MIAVIIAGGSGTRLWPLSTPNYPKHLLKFNGSDRSLLQHTYDRVADFNAVYVVSEASHAHHVREQLPELAEDHFIIEPARRGTGNCFLLALDHLRRQGVNPEETIAFVHADHYVRDVFGFRHSFHLAGKASAASGRLTLVGVEPDYPATTFGYIKKGKVFDEEHLVYEVAGFKEKPDFRAAQRYEKSGKYLWNCGYFIGSSATIERTMQDHAPDLHDRAQHLAQTPPDQITEAYCNYENSVIDYDLLELTPDLLVVPAAFDWMDLGGYADLHKASSSDENGNYVSGLVKLDEVENSYVQNAEDKPVAVIGLDNVVVVNTPHGIVVTRKDISYRVGAISKTFNTDK
jgi:mannose-1-phosphate guanylyltransferase/mannose-6-phosphate isomerase